MVPLTVDIFVLALLATGGAIWFGIWRGWVGKGGYYGDAGLFLPWFALGIGILRLGVILRSFGVPVPGELVALVPVASLVVGMWAWLVRWPDWVLPPWYRELEEDEEETEW